MYIVVQKLSMGSVNNLTDFVCKFNILNGFVVYVNLFIFVLKHSTDNLTENHEWDPKEIKIMHHSNMTFQKRLYSGFNLNFQTIQLEEAVSDILSQPLIHTRSLVPYHCYSALMKIYKVTQCFI